ncbi:MAG: penicillin-binding protein activator [SAR324 cluster bacterium]|nr:penicillin-binding protein activator [SAR324 cluster bacterium]
MPLLKKIIKNILYSLLLIAGSILSFSGIAAAQSLLSNSEGLKQNTVISIKKESTKISTPLRPSDLSSTPLILPEEDFFIFEEITSNNAGVSSNPVKPELPTVQDTAVEIIANAEAEAEAEKDTATETNVAESFISRLFPWFSSKEATPPVNSTTETEQVIIESKKEWADVEFLGVNTLVADLEELLISDPQAAREIYEEIAGQLQVDERTRLKIQLLYALKDWAAAELLAEAFLRERPQSPAASLVFYFLNKSLLQQHKPLSHDLILRERAAKDLKPKFRSEFLQILSEDALLKGDLRAAIQFRLAVLSNSETAKLADLAKLTSLLREVQSPEELRGFAAFYPGLSWLQEQIPAIELELLAKMQRYREALVLLEQRLGVARDLGNEELQTQLQQMQSRFTTALNVSPRRIGVILPLSSSSAKVAALAQQTLNGLWLALQANKKPVVAENIVDVASAKMELTEGSGVTVDAMSEPVPTKATESWELVVRDSHLSPEKTKIAIRELVEIERVIAIIGPLARKTSEVAAVEAERLRVPLISLSLTDSIPEIGEYIFRNNQSWKQEIQELLDYATSELQACRFLILYAKTREGRQKMRLFWNAVKRKGCEVVAVEGFKDEGQKSLVQEFDTFSGKSRRMSAKDEEILKELKEKEVSINNFDAVFVAVGSGGVKNLRMIFPYSAVYKMRKTTFLGDSGWNDPALPFAPGLRGVRKPIFVDSFSQQIETPALKRLLGLHERVLYQHQNYVGPSPYTAIAFDTLMLLMELLKDEGNQNHRNLRTALLNMQMYSGAMGNFRFDEKGEIQREMILLTLRRGKIQSLY